MDKDNEIYIVGIIVGLFIGVLFTLLILDNEDNHKYRELGQSICDQEHNLDFESYSNGNLKCKPKTIKEEIPYDGIIIQISEAT